MIQNGVGKVKAEFAVASSGNFVIQWRQSENGRSRLKRRSPMTEKRIPMRLWYRKSAPCGQDFIAAWDRTNDPMNGWEKWSLPIGNGDMGVNV